MQGSQSNWFSTGSLTMMPCSLCVQRTKSVPPAVDVTRRSANTSTVSNPEKVETNVKKEPAVLKDKPSATSSELEATTTDKVQQEELPPVADDTNTATAPTAIAAPGCVDISIDNVATSTDVEKSDVPKKPLSQEDEYKAKLAENRRLAREKAQREAEEQKRQAEERK